MTTEAESKKAEEGEEEEAQMLPMNEYYKPSNMYVIIEKEWVVFTLITTLVYCFHLVWMCYGVDVYASYERHIGCGDAQSNEDASAVYDTWILLCVIFHMVEWIRQTIFATSALVGVNLVWVYDGLILFVPFGIIVMLGGGIAAGLSDASCQEAQSARSTYLYLQFLACFLTLLTAALPFFIFKMRGPEWCHEVTIREDEEEDD